MFGLNGVPGVSPEGAALKRCVTREPISLFSLRKNAKNKEEKGKLNQFLELLRKKLPEGFKIGAAVGEGDSLFDSVAQGLNELRDKGLITSTRRFNVKSLRESCKQYAQEVNQSKKDSWLDKALKGEGRKLRKYIRNIGFAATDIENTSSGSEIKIIWGRPEIEGEMVCEKYGIKVRIIELRDEDIERFVTKSKLGTGNTVIYLVNYRNHFVPLLSNIQKNVKRSIKVCREEVYGDVIGSNSNNFSQLYISTLLQDNENFSHKQSGHLISPSKGDSETSRKRRCSIADQDNKARKRAHMDVNVTSNEDSVFPSDLQDEPRQDELHNACQAKRYIPHQLIGLMYQLDLSVLCSLRKSMYEHKYPSLSLTFGDSGINKYNNIVLRNKKKSIHIQIENVDKYYIDNDIGYARLFTKEKEKRSFFINDYFDSFVKHLISESNSLSNNIKYLVIYTNSGLDLTKEEKLKQGRSWSFYPFKFNAINMEECGILKDFLFTNDNEEGRVLYQFSQEETTREELFKRLEFSSAAQKVIDERKCSQEKVKEKFLDKLVFAVNQPNREELNSIVKSEIKNSKVQDNYIALQERILCDLTAPKKLGPGIIYEFNLLMSFLHDMFLRKNMFFINSKGKSRDTSNNIIINYKDRITYVKAHNADSDIGYSQLFPSRTQERKNKFSINKHFTLFIEELEKDKNIEYFIIYTNTCLDLTEEKRLKKGQSKDFHPLKLDSIDIQKKKYKILKDCSCIDKNGLYQFSQEETTKLSTLLKLPPSFQREKEEERLSDENEREIKEKFLNKLIFAVNQPNREELNSIIKNEIENKSNKVPYNYEELHEIALRWSESHEFGHITKGIMEKLLGDIKSNRSSYQEIQNKNIDEEIKFAKSVVGREGTPTFNQFLDFLIKGEGIKYLEVLKGKGINLPNMSSILNRAGHNAVKAFKDLYDLCILHGAAANAPKAFKGLYNIWFDGEGNKTQYLKALEEKGIDLTSMSSILNGAGANAPKAFKELYNIFFHEQGNKRQHLKHFFKKKDEESFTLHNLSSMLSGAGANVKDAFEKLHSVCFDDKGKRTELLDDFYNAGFRPGNLSCMSCRAGVHASSILKRLHSICFNEKREKTKLLDDFYNVGFRPDNLCNILSGAADSLKKFHDFCFVGETKKYLNHFLNEKEGFTLKNLSNILHGARANICSALKDFHDVCFDETGNKTQLLDDFHEAGFRSNDLSNILSMAGNNATSILRNFHKLCFSKENYLNHFLAEKKLFTPKDLSKLLEGVGMKVCSVFKKLHDLCFDKAGNKTNYLNNLIKDNPSNKIHVILYKKVRKASPTFLDEQNVSEIKGSKTTNASLNPSSSSGMTEQEQSLDSLQQSDSKIKKKARKGISNRSKNRQDDKVLDTVAGSSCSSRTAARFL
ncbi:hypothetical protein AVEN_108786-1 [Araneus ventricosus]|uniref:Uncharacterized protein n=1 Tax=Araneus ventricosus TaxID=182803 RepID=A0A4Y2CCR0_ARAVE|nr:hypothetical protein AVEN_108786-1 [Araneus ventricosus]